MRNIRSVGDRSDTKLLSSFDRWRVLGLPASDVNDGELDIFGEGLGLFLVGDNARRQGQGRGEVPMKSHWMQETCSNAGCGKTEYQVKAVNIMNGFMCL